MRSRLLVTLIIAALVACTAAAAAEQRLKADWSSYQAWVRQHNKPYQHDPRELAHRFQVWSTNVARINQLTASQPGSGSSRTHRLGLTAHTDLTPQEFRRRFLGTPMTPTDRVTLSQPNPNHHPSTHGQHACILQRALSWLSGALFGRQQQQQVSTAGLGKKKPKPQQHWRYENVTAPAAVDWRQHQPTVLGAIKDQHVNGTPCGSCWAFSAVSIMEIASAMATGSVVLASEQQLIDCDTKYDHGCSGGGWLNAIHYTIKNRGLAREEQYPYTGKDGQCNKKVANERHEMKVDSWEDVPFSNETELAKAVSQTPVIVAICVGPALDDWHHYAGGIFDAACCEKESEVTLDHGIVVVGYGTEGGSDYWILKNSWGSQWGEQGFMRIRRNHGKRGKCAMASFPAMVFRKPLPDGKGAARLEAQPAEPAIAAY